MEILPQRHTRWSIRLFQDLGLTTTCYLFIYLPRKIDYKRKHYVNVYTSHFTPQGYNIITWITAKYLVKNILFNVFISGRSSLALLEKYHNTITEETQRAIDNRHRQHELTRPTTKVMRYLVNNSLSKTRHYDKFFTVRMVSRYDSVAQHGKAYYITKVFLYILM